MARNPSTPGRRELLTSGKPARSRKPLLVAPAESSSSGEARASSPDSVDVATMRERLPPDAPVYRGGSSRERDLIRRLICETDDAQLRSNAIDANACLLRLVIVRG